VRGTLSPTAPVVLLRNDNGQPLRTQLNVLSRWPDGSVKTALLAVGEIHAKYGVAWLHESEIHGHVRGRAA